MVDPVRPPVSGHLKIQEAMQGRGVQRDLPAEPSWELMEAGRLVPLRLSTTWGMLPVVVPIWNEPMSPL